MIKEEQIPKRIREIRLERKLTQQDLADAVGVTKGYISKIENGASAPPVGTLIAFAQALKVELKAFFDTEEDPEVYVAITKKDQRPVVAEDGQGKYEHLAFNFPKRAFEAHVIKAQGPMGNTRPHKHKGQELLFVLRGRIEFTIDKNSFVLEAGDSVHFNAAYNHHGTCISDDGAELIGIIYNDRNAD